MPAFRIAVDDEVIATVDTAGMAVIDIRVTSMRTWQPRAGAVYVLEKLRVGGSLTYTVG